MSELVGQPVDYGEQGGEEPANKRTKLDDGSAARPAPSFTG